MLQRVLQFKQGREMHSRYAKEQHTYCLRDMTFLPIRYAVYKNIVSEQWGKKKT